MALGHVAGQPERPAAEAPADPAGATSPTAGAVDAPTADRPPGRFARHFHGRPAGPVVVLSLVTLIDQVDVNILRGVLPLLEDDFGLSDLQLGALGFAFVFVNALATIPAGWMADRVKRTTLIGWTLVSWSGLSALSAGAQNYPQLFGARASLGFGQAVDDPSSTSLLADYYPAPVRARIFSIQQVMTFIGAGLGLGLGGLVGSAFGWRWAFLAVGMPGSILAVVVFRLREPRRGEADGVPARESDPEPPPRVRELARIAAKSLAGDLRMIFAIRTMRYIVVGVSTLLFTVAGVGYWLAVYHERYSGFSEAEAAGLSAATLAVAGIVGTMWGGRVSDRLYGVSPAGRITQVANAILLCAALFGVSFLVPVPIRLALQFTGVAFAASAFPGLRASMMDVTPAQSRGVSASAFALTSTLFGTALAPPLVGLLSDLTGSLVVAFYLVTPPVVVGSLILRRAKDTIVEDAAAILESLAARSADVDGGEPGDAPELSL